MLISSRKLAALKRSALIQYILIRNSLGVALSFPGIYINSLPPSFHETSPKLFKKVPTVKKELLVQQVFKISLLLALPVYKSITALKQ